MLRIERPAPRRPVAPRRLLAGWLATAAVALLLAAGAGAEPSGDLNKNGQVDENDLRALNALCMKKPASHTISCEFADLDGDGRVTPTDFNDVLRPKHTGLKRESPIWQLMQACMKKPANSVIACSEVDMNGDGQIAPNDFFVLRGKVPAKE